MPAPAVVAFADVLCPFTHVVLRQFVRRRDELGLAQPVRVRAWPLERVNGEPVSVDHVVSEIAALREQMTPSSFAGFRPEAFPATAMPALELAAAAYAVGDATGERMSLALRDALFEDGRDVSDPSVLRALAADQDMDLPTLGAYRDSVEEDLAEGRRRGVEGSPHFFVGEHDSFAPGIQVEETDGEMRIRFDPARFEELVSAATRAGPP
jgi:predicted DsbA family dithiol-disulfide isomerase